MARRNVLYMSYGHRTCPIAIRHVLWAWGMSYGLRTCFMVSDLIISGLISRGLGGEALGQAGKFGETLGLPRAGGPKNEGDGPSPKTGWVASKTVGGPPKNKRGDLPRTFLQRVRSI